MGKLKQLMPMGKSTILEQTIDNFLGSQADEVIVVAGHRSEDTIKVIGGRPVKITINPAYRQGMSTSIVAGLSVVDSRAQAVMLALGDQPFIDSQTINHLIAEFYNHKKGIAIPVFKRRRGHPVIFDIKYREQLLRLEGDIGAREIIARHPEDVLEVAVNCEGIYIDIDTVDSYDLRRNETR